MENTNGGLNFSFEADTKDFKKRIEEARKKILGLGEEAQAAGKQIDDAFAAVKPEIKPTIDTQKVAAEAQKNAEIINKAFENIAQGMSDITPDNITIQKETISALEKQYADLEKSMEKIAPGLAKQELIAEALDIKAEIEGEKKALAGMQEYLKTTTQEHQSLNQKLAECKAQMADLVSEGKRNGAEYEQLKDKALGYQKAIDAVNAEMRVMSGEFSALRSVIGGLNLASGTFSALQGALGVLGDKNENLEKIMVRLQSAMSVSIGLSQIKTELDRKGGVIADVVALQEMARARATDMAAASAGRATIAQRLLNMVANANPYVLLATAILTVVGALALYAMNAKKAYDNQKELAKAIKEGNAETAKELLNLENLYRTAINDKLSREQRLKAVKDLKAAFPGLFSQIDNEIILNGKAAASYLAVRDAIMKSARAKAASSIIEKRTSDMLLSQQEAQEEIAMRMERLRKMEAAKKSGQKTMLVAYADIAPGYSGNINIEKQSAIEKKAIENRLRGITDSAQRFKIANSMLVREVEQGNNALFKATTEPPPKKGTDAYWGVGNPEIGRGKKQIADWK